MTGERVTGIGVDIVDIPRMDRALKRWGDRFVARVFTVAEVDYSRRSRRPAQHFSARFAAKEAVIKALGQGFRGGCQMSEIEVVAGELGRPLVRLHGATRRLAVSRGVENIFLSLSHSEKAAVAQAVAVGRAGEVEEEHAI